MGSLFTVHILNTEGINKARRLQNVFDDLLTEIQSICPEGRELSIVRTKLEEASFFAKKSMAMQKENQT